VQQQDVKQMSVQQF